MPSLKGEPKEASERKQKLTVRGSAIARDFSTALDSVFNLDPKLQALNRKVEEKQAFTHPLFSLGALDDTVCRKRSVSTQSRELRELEARIRATEERLRRADGPKAKGPQRGATEAGGLHSQEDTAKRKKDVTGQQMPGAFK